MQTTTSHTSSRQRGMILSSLLLANGIIAILVGLLLPAVQSAREAGRALQSHEATAELGAKIVAEANASEALRQRMLSAAREADDSSDPLPSVTSEEVEARITAIQELRVEIDVTANYYAILASPEVYVVGRLGQAAEALARVQQSFTAISNVMK